MKREPGYPLILANFPNFYILSLNKSLINNFIFISYGLCSAYGITVADTDVELN